MWGLHPLERNKTVKMDCYCTFSNVLETDVLQATVWLLPREHMPEVYVWIALWWNHKPRMKSGHYSVLRSNCIQSLHWMVFHTVAFPQLTSGLVWFPTFLQVVPFVVLSCYSQTTIQIYIFNLIIHHSQGFTTIAGLLPFGLVCNLTFNSKICNV